MIPIYIGTEPAQKLATEVLKWSVLRRTKAQVEFHELSNLPLGLKSKMYTGFSFYRYAIPEKCSYQGRAIYLDADIIVLADIEELFSLKMDEKGVLARPQDLFPKRRFTSVMLMDCEKLKHWNIQNWVSLINTGMESYQGLMEGRPGSLNHADFGDLPAIWNTLDLFVPETKILHYTHVPSQPWKKPGHPFEKLFLEELQEAIKANKVSIEDVEKEIALGHVYPTILHALT